MPGPDRSPRRILAAQAEAPRGGALLAAALLAVALLAVAAGRGTAEDTGTIVGRIFDATTRAPLPLATVIIHAEPSPWGAATDGEGQFRLRDISGGAWQVTFSAPGFQTVLGVVAVGAGETTGVSASLQPGADTLVVTGRQVGPRAPLVVAFPREPDLEGDGLIGSWYSVEFPRAVGFSADGRRLGLGTRTGLTIYRPRNRQLLIDRAWSFPPLGPSDLTVAAGPEGVLRIRVSADSLALVKEPDPHLADWPVERLAGAAPSAHLRVAFSDDRARLVAWGPATRRPVVWRLADGHALAKLPTELDVQCAAFAPDGSTLTLGGRGGKHVAEVWDLAARSLRGKLSADSAGADVRTLAADPQGRFVVAGHADLTLSCWNLDDLSLRWRVAPGGCCAGEFLALSPDGRLLATGSGSGVVFIDTGSGAVVRKLKTNHVRGIRGAAFAPDGGSLATIGYDSRLALWSVDRVVAGRQ